MEIFLKLPNALFWYFFKEYMDGKSQKDFAVAGQVVKKGFFLTLKKKNRKCQSEFDRKVDFNRLYCEATQKPCLKRFCEGCHTIAHTVFECSFFDSLNHEGKIDYFHFPRDVDIVTTYVDGESRGYSML